MNIKFLRGMINVHVNIVNIIRVINSFDPDQDRHSVGPDLGASCLQDKQTITLI